MLYPFELRALRTFALYTELLFTNVFTYHGQGLGAWYFPALHCVRDVFD